MSAAIDIIDEATDGTRDGQIGSDSRIAVVSFADTASKDTQLITSVSDLKAAVDALTAEGNTNHADAFTKASELLSGSSNAKVMVMFTDGETTVGPNPSPFAAAARAAGTIISKPTGRRDTVSGQAKKLIFSKNVLTDLEPCGIIHLVLSD